MYIVAYYASFLIALVYSSELQIAYPSDTIKVAFYDFDKTTTIYSFGPIVRDVCNATAIAAGKYCGETSGDMETALATISDDNVKAAFGDQERIDTLATHWKTIIGADSSIEKIFILSTSWEPVPAAEWKAMIVKTFDRIGLSDIFDANNVLTLDDPGPGISADKGAVAKTKMVDLSFTTGQCINADDSQGNIDSQAGRCTYAWDPPCCEDDTCDDIPRERTCETLQVIPREGMSAEDLTYIESRGIPVDCSGVATYKNDCICFFVFVFCVFMLR